MSNSVPTTAPGRARVDRRRRISLIWAIPVVTVLIAAWLTWDTYSKRGPTITVTFDGAEGLLAGQSHIKHKDVDMGLVQSVVLTQDKKRVLVSARMNREATSLLTDQTKFWVVRPRFFAGNISGLSTLLSGSYIELLPGDEGAPKHQFTGLEDPPVLQADIPGTTFLLKADRIGSVNLGSPIFYRDMSVGEVLGSDLGDMAETVTIHAFVRAPFDKYVRDESRFWNASGLSVKLGAEGVQLQVESLKAVLLGGIAFDTPAAARASATSGANQTFPLYADRDAADKAGFRRRVQFAGYFTGSVSGLAPGSPVTFQGLPVGDVRSVGMEYDPKSDSIRAPVRFEVEPERIAHINLAEARGPIANTRMLVARGLRAQLQSANLVTGQMMVALAIIPDAAPAEMQVDGDVIILPTIPGQFAGLTDSANQLLAKLSSMPFEQIGANLNDTLKGLKDLANGEELKASLTSVQGLLGDAQTLVKQADLGLSPAFKQMPALASNLQAALTHSNKLLVSADSGYGENSKFSRDLERIMVQLNETARSFRALSDLLTRHPEALIRGRTNTGPE
jgi:paraquat-inducible protein B